MKKQQKIVILVFVLFAMVSTAWSLVSRKAPVMVPTEPISHTQGTGGKPAITNTHTDTTGTVPNHTAVPAHPTGTQRRQTQGAVASQPIKAAPESAVKEYPYHALGTTPNDPQYAASWVLQKTNAAAAWNITTGSTVIVADIDTGYALQHEDLQGSWYQNPGETGTDANGKDKATNGIDDDGNGYVDDWRGWNFYGRYQPTADPCTQNGLGSYVENNNPQAGQSGDDVMYQETKTCFGTNPGDPHGAISHGTSTAGLIGATTNNGVGIATMNWNTKIMPLQALGDDGSGWTSDIVKAVRYAVDNGAQVINMSLGGPDFDPAMQSAIDYAYSHNVVVVAAAGNCGTGNEGGCDNTKPGQMMYPSLYQHVIAVGATDQNDTRASFSSYGRGLDIAAPGYGNIVAPLIDTRTTPYNYTNGYSSGLAGTSFSSPIVASAASLVRSMRPGTSVDDVIAILDATARKPSTMNGQLYTTQYGHGVVDAGRAAAIASTLNKTAPVNPAYTQTGNSQSEHMYSASTTLPSACTVVPSGACTVRFVEDSTGYERYLPYANADAQGMSAWQWQGSLLDYGTWWGKAESGDSFSSNDYMLFNK